MTFVKNLTTGVCLLQRQQFRMQSVSERNYYFKLYVNTNREEIQYVINTYGDDSVQEIIVFSY